MRSVIKISVLAMLLATMVVGQAFAEMSLSGSVSITAGRLSVAPAVGDAPDPEWFGGTEGLIDFKGGTDDLKIKLRHRTRDDGAVNTVRANAEWVMGSMSVVFHGRSFGLNGSHASAFAGNTYMSYGDMDATQVHTLNKSGVTLDLSVGPKVSVGLFAGCWFCALDANLSGAQTLVLGVSGAAGDIGYNFAYLTGSGTIAKGTEIRPAGSPTITCIDGDGSGSCTDGGGGDVYDVAPGADASVADKDYTSGANSMIVGVQYNTDAFNVALDYSKKTDLAISSTDKDSSSTVIGFLVGAANAALSVNTQTTDVGGTAGDGSQHMALSYKIPISEMGFGSVEYRSVAAKPVKGSGDKSSFIGFGLQSKF